MPDRKKPTRAPAKGAPAKRAPARKAPTPARKAATKPSAARAKRAPTEDLEPLDLDGLELEEGEETERPTRAPRSAPASRRASLTPDLDDAADADARDDHDDDNAGGLGQVAIAAGPFVDDDEVGGIPPVIRFGDDDAAPSEALSTEDEPLGLERPREELLVGVAAVLLGASVFLPWFGQGFSQVTGWAGGLWGPVIAFLALAVVVTVVLRRLQVPVAFPIDHAAIFEVIGWLAVVGLVASRFFGVEVDGAPRSAQRIIFVPIVFAAALAMLAGRVSSGSPFVVRPGWYRGNAGRIGTAVLVVSLAGGLGFGLTGTPAPPVGPNRLGQTKQFRGVLPPCAKSAKFPSPAGVKYQLSFQLPNGLCQVTFSSTLTIEKLTSVYKTALTAAGWTYTAVPAPGTITFQLRKPRCGALNISEPPSTVDRSKTKTRTGIAFFQTQCITPGSPGTEPPN